MDIFACGFKTGKTRVFDIKECKVGPDDFKMFDEAVVKIKYSPKVDILVTVCENGSVAIHNVTRQHQPTKKMALEFPPKYVHVAFSPTV